MHVTEREAMYKSFNCKEEDLKTNGYETSYERAQCVEKIDVCVLKHETKDRVHSTRTLNKSTRAEHVA